MKKAASAKARGGSSDHFGAGSFTQGAGPPGSPQGTQPNSSPVARLAKPRSSSSPGFLDAVLAHPLALASSLLVTVALAGITFLYWEAGEQRRQQAIQSQMSLETQELTALVSARLSVFESIARALKGLVEGSFDVTESEFLDFAAAQRTDAQALGLMAVALVDNTVDSEQTARIMRSVSPTAALAYPASQQRSAPIVLIAPRTSQNEAVLGSDLWDNDKERRALQVAAITTGATLTERLDLLQVGDSGAQVSGFVMYVPIYHRGNGASAPAEADVAGGVNQSWLSTSPGGDLNPFQSDAVEVPQEDRERLLRGWAAVVFEAADILVPLTEFMPPGVRIRLYEGEINAESHVTSALNGAEIPYEVDSASPHRAQQSISFGSSVWYVVTDPMPEFLAAAAAADPDRMRIIWLGILFSLTGGVLSYVLLSAHGRIQVAARQMTRDLRAVSARLSGTLEALPDILFEVDASGRVLSARAGSDKGRARFLAKMPGKTFSESLPPEVAQVFAGVLSEAAALGRSAGTEVKIGLHDGGHRWYEISAAQKARDGANYSDSVELVVIARDVTDRVEAEFKVREQAYSDVLTGLPNRTSFQTHTEDVLSDSASRMVGLAMIIDLDDFKSVNDNWGHKVGDRILQEVASRIREAVRAGCPGGEGKCFIARLGADEFAVMMRDVADSPMAATNKARDLCEAVLAKISEPMRIAVPEAAVLARSDKSGDSRPSQELFRDHCVTATAGLTFFGMVKLTPKDLLTRADAAMRAAKADGRGGYRLFDAGMQQVLSRKSRLEGDLRIALAAEQLFLVYQPQVNAAGAVVGAEVLLRWRHPEFGLISPAEFIPIAEATGLIVPIGEWVLVKAARTLSRWKGASAAGLECPGAFERLSLAVNVSTRQFGHPDFVDQVTKAVDLAGIAPDGLKLELTESLLAFNLDDIIAKMGALKAKGFRFSLDDFGTGYSSLRYLKKLPLSQLKIDQSFVADVLEEESDANIARTIIKLGEQMGLDVIAEGVETQAQVDWLRENGCFAYQGYLFSKPVSLEEFEEVTINRYPLG